jgi:DNA-binding IclR family transcriptional regulator
MRADNGTIDYSDIQALTTDQDAMSGVQSSDDSASPEKIVRVLARGLQILKAFEPRNGWLSNNDISARTALPKPTVSRLTATLTTLGYLTYSHPKGRYRLSPLVLTLGYLALSNLGLRAAGRPMMQQLADRENAVVVLAERDDMAMVCSEVCHNERSVVALRVHRGSRLVLPYSAAGRAYIGALDEPQRQALLREIAQRFPDAWPSLEGVIGQATDEIAARGFCVTSESLERGINGVGVSVEIPNMPNRYALGCAAPAYLFPREHLEREIGPALLVIKKRIEAHFAITANRTEA